MQQYICCRMDYQQTLDYLYHTLPMFSHVGTAAFKKDLTNITILCNHLDNPQKKFRSIHIAGTNGKGSVSHMLAAILQTASYKTGLYTSPHLKDFRERIKIDGHVTTEAFVVHFVETLKPVIETIRPSFFEITVALAFQYFAEQQVDVAVIEVGLGGRLDSTNIIEPELSVITNISWDHMNILGDTLLLIAQEKAGIIKEHIPVVVGACDEQTAPVFEAVAAAKKAPLFIAGNRFSIDRYSLETDALLVTIQDKQYGVLKKFALDLPGIYQLENIKTVLQAAAVLQDKGFVLTDPVIATAVGQTKQLTGLLGRWDVVRRTPTVVLEVGHNEAGIQQILEHVRQLNFKKLHLIIGFVKDKEIEKVLSLLPQSATFYFTHAHIPRALNAAVLQQIASRFLINGEAFDDVNEALQKALQQADKQDLIIVCGSIFLVAEVDTARLVRHDA